MSNCFKTIVKKVIDNDKLIFIIVSVVFGFSFCFVNIVNDDAVYYNPESFSVSDYWGWSVSLFETWSSRVLINFTWMLVLNLGSIAFGIYMGVSMFLLQYALSKLFVSTNFKMNNLFVSFIVMLFPFHVLSTAGWVSTSTCYFGPLAIGLVALIPIKKIYHNEKIKKKEYVLYSLCLIYAANNEQMMAVLLACYAIATIYFTVRKKNNIYIYILTLFSVASFLVTFLCPGNKVRKISETSSWFPTYGMLTIFDKIDIGVSTTLKWLLFENNLYVIVTCIILSYFIFKNYKEFLFRTISIIPVASTVLFGPLKSITILLFPNTINVTNQIPYYGLLTIENEGNSSAFLQFVLMFAIIICICLEIFLLSNKLEDLIVSMVILGAGLASRVALAFSPTIYASNNRTYTVLTICIMAVAVQMFAKNSTPPKYECLFCDVIKMIMISFIGLSFVNLWF